MGLHGWRDFLGVLYAKDMLLRSLSQCYARVALRYRRAQPSRHQDGQFHVDSVSTSVTHPGMTMRWPLSIPVHSNVYKSDWPSNLIWLLLAKCPIWIDLVCLICKQEFKYLICSEDWLLLHLTTVVGYDAPKPPKAKHDLLRITSLRLQRAFS